MAVSNTYTLENSYGTRVVVRGAGFLLNNEMTDFNPKPGVTDREGTDRHEAEPDRARQADAQFQTPTIVPKDGKPVLITGSPGGRTIINTVLCVVLNVIDFDMPVQDAVDAPRLHHQWFPDAAQVRGREAVPGTGREAEGDGPHASRKHRQGDAHTIWIDPKTGIRIGAADKRLDGKAAGSDSGEMGSENLSPQSSAASPTRRTRTASAMSSMPSPSDLNTVTSCGRLAARVAADEQRGEFLDVRPVQARPRSSAATKSPASSFACSLLSTATSCRPAEHLNVRLGLRQEVRADQVEVLPLAHPLAEQHRLAGVRRGDDDVQPLRAPPPASRPGSTSTPVSARHLRSERLPPLRVAAVDVNLLDRPHLAHREELRAGLLAGAEASRPWSRRRGRASSSRRRWPPRCGTGRAGRLRGSRSSRRSCRRRA